MRNAMPFLGLSTVAFLKSCGSSTTNMLSMASVESELAPWFYSAGGEVLSVLKYFRKKSEIIEIARTKILININFGLVK